MHRRFQIVPALLVALAAALPVRAQDQVPSGTYAIDPAHASIYFHISHLNLSQIYGRFNKFTGNITLGEQPNVAVTIETGSIDTGVPRRDDHLRSPDFFDARQFPQITFQSTSVTPTDNGYEITGDFTMHGQTKQITIPMALLGPVEMQGKERIGLTGELTIDRTEWGISGASGMVGNDVHIMLSVEAIKQ